MSETRTDTSCLNCKHYDKADKAFACAAFPDGIPFPIASGEVSHSLPFEGDNGIQFEAKDDEE